MGCRTPVGEIQEDAGYVTAGGEVAKWLPLLSTAQRVLLPWGFGAWPGI